MKIVKCDICKKDIEKRRWLKMIVNQIAKKLEISNMDLCPSCHAHIHVFIELLTKAEGRLDWMLAQNSLGKNSLFQILSYKVTDYLAQNQ